MSIPLAAFARVDFGLMNNVSIYVDGQIAGTEPQTVYIGGLEFI